MEEKKVHFDPALGLAFGRVIPDDCLSFGSEKSQNFYVTLLNFGCSPSAFKWSMTCLLYRSNQSAGVDILTTEQLYNDLFESRLIIRTSNGLLETLIPWVGE